MEKLKEAAINAEAAVENLKAELVSLEGAETVDKDAVKTKRAEIRTAESVLKKANTAVTKAQAAEKKEAEKAEKKATADKVKADKAEKLEQTKIDKKAEVERKAAEREANRMPEQNGVRRPKPATLCGKAWALADKLSAEMNQAVPVKALLVAAAAEGLNEGNVKAEYARWRKFNGVTGRVTSPKAAETETPANTGTAGGGTPATEPAE